MRLAILPSGSIILPPLPVWPAGDRFRVMAGLAEFQSTLRRHSPAIRFGTAKDASYLLVPTSVLGAALAWTLRALAAQGVSYSGEAFDCEDFVNELDSTLRKMAARAGIRAAPLTCCLSVLQQNDWAGVPGGGAHALAAVHTDSGVWIAESQNGRTTPVETFPNRSTMLLADNF